ncbi:bile acid:sodium symporter family protein [Chryseolinea lacunae]|uniref:bile acid:sodium symporter family protein n=1 Tax=Chryseolinea lacunae TaxID=2801331 RepID=UPI003F70D9B8
MNNLFSSKTFFFLAILFIIGYVATTLMDLHQYAGLLLMGFFVMIALGFRGYALLKGYSYTIMIFAAVSVAMYYPQYFVTVGGFKLSKLIVPLLQLIMFGMGTALSWKDFARVMQMPKGVIVGVLCHYTIMPLVGWTVTQIFSFPPEIAAGIILIGSCPNGLASNVMSYLARANLALSVTLTAISTLLAPLITPMFMNLLAGQYVEIDFWVMVWDITKIIILPIGGGLLFNHFLHGKFAWLDAVMPLVSMISIALIIVVITSAGRDSLLVVGPLLIVAVLMHNISGYLLGYWISRGLRMSEKDCRTLALEVGLQNGGLASGIALTMGKLSTVGLAAAVFGPMMNITGSSLALWWRGRTPPEDQETDAHHHA